MPLCRGAVFEMEHQGLVREGIDALDSFQKDALIKLGKAEHLGGKVVEQLLRDLGCAAGRQICLHHSWAVPEMSLPACASLVAVSYTHLSFPKNFPDETQPSVNDVTRLIECTTVFIKFMKYRLRKLYYYFEKLKKLGEDFFLPKSHSMKI